MPGLLQLLGEILAGSIRIQAAGIGYGEHGDLQGHKEFFSAHYNSLVGLKAASATGHVHESHNLRLASKIKFVTLGLAQQGQTDHAGQFSIAGTGTQWRT